MNDLIGIGCTVDSSRNRDVEVGGRIRSYKCFVYKLKNCDAPQITEDIISLSDDEENDIQPGQNNEDESIVQNGQSRENAVTNGDDYNFMDLLDSGDEMLVHCASNGVSAGQYGAAAGQSGSCAVVNEDEDADDNDIEQTQWSQQVLLNIKEDAQQSFVISDDDDDGSNENYGHATEYPTDDKNDQEENDNEIDCETSKWISKLSQDQDKVQEKSAEKYHQKQAKMIDSMPMKRRQSVSSRASTPAVLPKRRKSVCTSPSAPMKSSPLAERRKSVSSARPKISIKLDGFIHRHEPSKKDLAECRKAKLSEIAQNQQLAKLAENANSKERIATKPKVKIFESRGTFLQEPITTEKKRLKSKSEVDENRKQHQLIGVASTSRGPARRIELDKGYVDHFDPFAVALRNSAPEPPKTLDGAFAEIDKHYVATPKKRISRVKSIHNSTRNEAEPKDNVYLFIYFIYFIFTGDANGNATHPPSILKKTKDGNEKRELKVVFRDEIVDERSGELNELKDVFEFEVGDNENDVILVNVPCAESVSRSVFQTDPLHRIISEVTSWNVDWLLKKNKLPPITDADHVITPLLSKYPSFEVFQK